eukprot:gene10432-14013_t
MNRQDSRERNNVNRQNSRERNNDKRIRRSNSRDRYYDSSKINEKYKNEINYRNERNDNRRDNKNYDDPINRDRIQNLAKSSFNNKKGNQHNMKPPKQESYRPSSEEVWGKQEIEEKKNDEEVKDEVIYKPDFGLSGALAKDKITGNTVNGVVLKWTEPLDSAKPTLQWRLYVFKEDKIVETLFIHRKSCYLIGRDNRVADVIVAHPSCSKQHAVIQFREKRNKTGGSIGLYNESDFESGEIVPYLMDLGSPHKTFLNGKEIEDARYYQLKVKDCIKFGGSTREYILLNDSSLDE